jgi:hypothetical protein
LLPPLVGEGKMSKKKRRREKKIGWKEKYVFSPVFHLIWGK